MGSWHAESCESAAACSECSHGCCQAAAQAGGRVENSAKALEQTKALADTLASDKDGKFANSKFLQFVSKMSRGEILLEGNEVSESPSRVPDVHPAGHIARPVSRFPEQSGYCGATPVHRAKLLIRHAAGDVLHRRPISAAVMLIAGEGDSGRERCVGTGV